MPDLSNMTQAIWDRMPEETRAKFRDLSGLTPQLIGLEGWRVEVTLRDGGKPYRFIVGRSTGWRPCHLEIERRTSRDGSPARDRYHTVRRLNRIR